MDVAGDGDVADVLPTRSQASIRSFDAFGASSLFRNFKSTMETMEPGMVEHGRGMRLKSGKSGSKSAGAALLGAKRIAPGKMIGRELTLTTMSPPCGRKRSIARKVWPARTEMKA